MTRSGAPFHGAHGEGLCPTCAPVRANGAARKARERDKRAKETRLRGCVRSAMRTGLGQPAPCSAPVIYIFSGMKIYAQGRKAAPRFAFIGIFADNFQRK